MLKNHPGKLIAVAVLALFFVFNLDVFHFVFVMALLCLPAYLMINKWLDSID